MSGSDPRPEKRPEPVAIVGLAALFPKAEGLDAYWANLRDGVDCIEEVPASHWKPEEYYDADPRSPDRTYARRGGFLPAVRLDPRDLGVSPNALEATDSAQVLGLEVARRALEDAGLGAGGRAFDRDRASVILGVTGTLQLVVPLGARLGHPLWRRALREAGVEDARAEEVVRRIADGYVPWKEDSFPGLLGNVVAGRIANRLDLHGTNCVVDAACASSLSALHLALLELAAGRSDLVVTGGVDAFNDVFMYMCFSKTPALSPTGDARPFDAAADGTTLGEGVGMMVLKRLSDAERDGDRIYARILGVGSSSDGKGEAIYAPTVAGQARALRAAYRAAGVSPATVELVEGHGTGTKVGDGIELQALTEVFREVRPEGTWCALGSVKSQIGHAKAAAGAAGLLKAALALYRKVLPPTLKVTRPLEALARGTTPFHLLAEKRPWLPAKGHPRRAAVSSFGFGGSNFHCVLEEAGPLRASADEDGAVQVMPFAADSREEVATAVAAFPRDLPWPAFRARAAAARRAFDPRLRCRLVLCVERGRTDLARLLEGARSLLEKPGARTSWSTPDGAHYGEGEAAGRLGVLFPGQGSQYTGMLRDLACRCPEMLETLAEADEVFQANSGPGSDRRLSDHIYPPSAFDDGAREAQEAALRATQVAQPAIGAVSLGALRVLEEFGVRPDAVAGHSYGELLALCAAGRYDARALHRLSGLRGRLMADGSADQGAMLAVQAPLETVERVLREERLDLVVANRNAPSQAVVSGATPAIERAAATFAGREIRAKRLPVAAAFHSPLVAHAREPMRAALRDTVMGPPRIPVYANATAREYPADPGEAAELLASQLAMPVEFVRIVENMHAAGVRTFLEVGPGARLSSLVGAILQDRPHDALALDASSGRRSGAADLGNALAHLAALGHAVDLPRWDGAPPEAPPARPGFTVEVSGAPSPRTTPVRPTTALPPAPVPAAAAPAAASGISGVPAAALSEALRLARENMAALQEVQTRTADMHRLFLEGQDRVRHALQSLLEQQVRSLGGVAPAAAAAAFLAIPPALVGGSASAAAASQVAATGIREPVPMGPLPAEQAPPPQGLDAVAAALLQAVAEKTGYPAEMLNLDMGMDADLGIDSIKRVEILSALQERIPGLPPVRPDRMGSFRTLRDVVGFLAGGEGASGAAQLAAPGLRVGTDSRIPGAASCAATGTPSSRVADVLLQAVSDRTGYPVEMLGLEMSLDADLGIDSIKRVEILSAVQERLPGLAAIRPDHLGKFRNLREVVEHLAGGDSKAVPGRSPGGAGPVAAGAGSAPPAIAIPRQGAGGSSLKPAQQAAPPQIPAQQAAPLQRLVVRCVPHVPSEAQEAVRVRPGDPVWVAGPRGDAFSAALAESLRSRGLDARAVPPGGPAETPDRLGGLVLVAPEGTDDAAVKGVFGTLRRAADPLRAAARDGGAFLATVSRMDGSFGFAGGEESAARGLAGVLKTAAREWEGVACRAIDLDPRWTGAPAANAVAAAVLARGPLETGLGPGGAVMLAAAGEPLPADPPALPLRGGEVVVVTGGARGVTAACALALARAARPTLVLLGRSPAPGEEPAWLRGLAAEAEVKRAFLERSRGRASPREAEAAWRECAAAREIRAALRGIEEAGARAIYLPADVRDAAAVRAALDGVRREHGPVVGVVHGAGVLADAPLDRKTSEQVDRVFGTKVEGLRSVLDAVGRDDLRFLAVFSSSTARLGRAGQADYAAANEALNALARAEARRRPGCRVAALDWGPWAGGMVTPALARMFEAEGVGLIPLEAGAEHLLAEIAAARPGECVEAVVLGPAPGGAAPVSTAAPVEVRVHEAPALERAFELEVDEARFPILRSHRLDGRAVVPAALLLEWIAHGALHGNPGLAFHGVEEFRVLKGIALEGTAAARVRVLAGRAAVSGDSLAVPVEVRGGRDPGERIHARATVLLAEALPPAPAARLPAAAPTTASRLDPGAAYREVLFHGPDLRAITGIESLDAAGAAVAARAAPPPGEWIARPLRGSWIADPMAVDAAFQAAILWSVEASGAPSLPTGFARYRQYRRAFPREGVRVALAARGVREHEGLLDIEFTDASGALVARMEGFTCVVDASLRGAFRSRGPA